jgi:hypothetical protein
MVKSLSGHVHRCKDNLVYGFRAQYHHDGQTTQYGYKIPWAKNEKATIIRLRKMGFAVQAISDFTALIHRGTCPQRRRSYSAIHNLLKRVSKYDVTVRYFSTNSIRKLAYQTHTTQSKNRWAKMMRLWHAWEMFALGLLDRPP